MARVQCLMLSGRYRTEVLRSHWSVSGSVACRTPACQGEQMAEDIEHILEVCGSLVLTRNKLLDFTTNYCWKHEIGFVVPMIRTYCSPTHRLYSQFMLDCSCIPDIISATQAHGQIVLHHLFSITRVWCYCLHRDRLRALGLWHGNK